VPLPREATLDVICALAHDLATLGGWRPMREAFQPKPGSSSDYVLVEEPLPVVDAEPGREGA
jgi:hypothetical protein